MSSCAQWATDRHEIHIMERQRPKGALNKGFNDIFSDIDADFFCLQETKLQEGQTDFAPDGYSSYWNYAEKKGYSGVAIFSRHTPTVW